MNRGGDDDGGRGGGDRGGGRGGEDGGGGRGGEDRVGGGGVGDRVVDHPKPFAGMRFKLVGMAYPDEKKYKIALENGGATDSGFYGPKSECTHLIVPGYFCANDHAWCVKGREGGAKVLNHMWLNHCIRKGYLVRAEKIMYQPYFSGGVDGGESLTICCSGYTSEEYEDIKLMVFLIGGKFLDKWSSLVTHVICFHFEGSTYEQAKKSSCKIVNESWLKDSLNEWKILPSDNYSTPGESLDNSPPPGFSTPTLKSATQSSERLSKSTGNKRPRRISRKNLKCVRFLEYSPERSFPVDEYVRLEDRVISVKYPYESKPQELTHPEMKRIILKSFVRVCHLHNDNRSLDGNFNCSNFIVSVPNEIVRLCDVSVVELTPKNRKADKDTFVKMVKDMFSNELPPDDLNVWLDNISEGWDDALLLQHMNMGDTNNTWGQFITLFNSLLKLEKNDWKKYQKFLRSMAHYDDWYEQGFKWTKLEENKDYVDQRDARLATHEPSTKKNEVDPYRLNAHGFIKVIKNTWSHPAKAYQEFFLAIVLRERKSFLSKFQKALYDSGFYGKGLSVKHFM